MNKNRKYSISYILFVTVALLNIFMMFVANTQKSYSLFDVYEAYHPLDNWNFPTHASGLFDYDNQEDLIEYGGCSFLTRSNNMTIDMNQACEMTSKPLSGKIAFRKMKLLVGTYHSFIAKNPGENWKIYEQVMFVPIVHEIMPDGVVKKTGASLMDWVDALWYMVTHLFTISPFL
jgi:hypothetical protein